jgi:hypothetical protein
MPQIRNLPVAGRTAVGMTRRPMNGSNSNDDIGKFYGFNSYAELLSISDTLSKQPGDAVQSHVAHKPNGQWFVWTDELPPDIPSEPRYAVTL